MPEPSLSHQIDPLLPYGMAAVLLLAMAALIGGSMPVPVTFELPLLRGDYGRAHLDALWRVAAIMQHRLALSHAVTQVDLTPTWPRPRT